MLMGSTEMPAEEGVDTVVSAKTAATMVARKEVVVVEELVGKRAIVNRVAKNTNFGALALLKTSAKRRHRLLWKITVNAIPMLSVAKRHRQLFFMCDDGVHALVLSKYHF